MNLCRLVAVVILVLVFAGFLVGCGTLRGPLPVNRNLSLDEVSNLCDRADDYHILIIPWFYWKQDMLVRESPGLRAAKGRVFTLVPIVGPAFARVGLGEFSLDGRLQTKAKVVSFKPFFSRTKVIDLWGEEPSVRLTNTTVFFIFGGGKLEGRSYASFCGIPMGVKRRDLKEAIPPKIEITRSLGG